VSDIETLSKENRINAEAEINTQDKTFTIIDNWLLDSNLSVHEKIVFIAVKRHLKQCASSFLSHEMIAGTASLSPSAVKRALAGLLRRKLLCVKSNKRNYKPNEYSLADFGRSTRPTVGLASSSARPTTGGSVGPTNKNTQKQNTLAGRYICCFCRQRINETLRLIDSNGVEYTGCVQCRSDMIIDIPRSPVKIDVESLLNTLKRNDPLEVFKAVDVIQFKSKHGDDITSFSGLLVTMLRYGIMVPDDYIPPIERRRREAHMKALAVKKRDEEQKKETEYLAKRQVAEQRIQLLSEKDRIALELEARNQIPKTLRSFPRYVNEKMISLMIEMGMTRAVTDKR
jgi:hypothetical protein